MIVWLHPHEHGPPYIKMMNLSDKPIFEYGCLIEAEAKREIEKLDPKGHAGRTSSRRWHSDMKDIVDQQ